MSGPLVSIHSPFVILFLFSRALSHYCRPAGWAEPFGTFVRIKSLTRWRFVIIIIIIIIIIITISFVFFFYFTSIVIIIIIISFVFFLCLCIIIFEACLSLLFAAKKTAAFTPRRDRAFAAFSPFSS